MRRSLAGIVAVAVGAVVAYSPGALAVRPSTPPTLSQCQSIVRHQVITPGHLTLATDNPVYPPWFINDRPTNQQGFEGALAYRIAKELEFPATKVKWVVEPFTQSYAPGAKAFDFDINEVSYSAARAQNVTFSASYYNISQAIVALRGKPIVTRHTPKELQGYRFGAVTGTTSLAYVVNHIKPTRPPFAYPTLIAAVGALKLGQINAIVTDTPEAYFTVHTTLTTSASTIGALVGQFPSIGDLYYALVLQKANPLVTCLNVAISSARSSGALTSIRIRWLGIYNSVPIIQP